MPILDDEEYATIYRIFLQGIERLRSGVPADEAIKAVRQAYSEMTGAPETHENAILHHNFSYFGPPCERCGKPYRTDKASFCAGCGHVRPKTGTGGHQEPSP
jgi:hypothetical protein